MPGTRLDQAAWASPPRVLATEGVARVRWPVGEPSDVAQAAISRLSAAAFITGQVIPVNGGFRIRPAKENADESDTPAALAQLEAWIDARRSAARQAVEIAMRGRGRLDQAGGC